MIGSRRLLVAVALAMIGVGDGLAQSLQAVETEQLRLLYFDPTETYLVPRLLQTYHDSLDRQRSILGYAPADKTTVVLTDFSDYGNASASVVPANTVVVDVAPVPFTFETFSPAERMYSLMNHELVHIATMDHAAPTDSGFRRFFGGKVLPQAEHPETILYQYLTTPRVSSPAWYREGIATFQETWMGGGLGRSQGGYDEMVFRAMVRDGARFYDPLGLVSEGVKVDFQAGANAYLYGQRFMSYLAYAYTPEMLVRWVMRSDENHRGYREGFADVYERPLEEVWQEWVGFEHEFQERNLVEIRRYPTTPYEELSETALGSVSRAFYDPERNSIIAGVLYPGVVAHIGEYSLDTRTMQRLQDIKVPMIYRVSSLAYDPASAVVFYTTDHYAYRDLMALDLGTGKARRLLKDERIGEIVFNGSDRSIWGLRHLNGYVSLVRIPFPYEQWELVTTFAYGVVGYDLDISADGSRLSGSFGDAEGKQTLKVFQIEELLAGDVRPIAHLDLGSAVPEGFVFSPDGEYLFGSAYYTGVSNIFRFEIATEEFEAVSNTESGFFRPIPIDNDELLVFHYTGQGFVPARIKAELLEDVSAISFFGTEVISRHPELRQWQAGVANAPGLEPEIVSRGEYVPAKNLGLESIYPVMLGYKDSESLGIKAIFSDPVRLDSLSLGAGYSIDSELPTDERLNLSVEYRHTTISTSPLAGTWHFGAYLNDADFYDLFGPTKSSRKGQRYSIGYDKTLILDWPRTLEFSAAVNHFRDIDALPRYQNIATTIADFSTIEAYLEYENVRRSLGAVDDEKGFSWDFGTSASFVDGDTIPKIGGSFDVGFALPIRNSSIWLRNSAGAAFGEPDDEFANFYFGGYGNNYVDRGAIKRYREFYSMPGFELNAIPGRNFYRGMLEWNLPPIRFERVGTPNFYLTWIRPAIFAATLSTDLDRDEFRNDAQSYGIQLDLRFTLMSRFNMTLSTGYAKAYGEGDFSDDEFMISLKIL